MWKAQEVSKIIYIYVYIYIYFFFIFIGSNFKGGALDLDKQDDALYLFIFFLCHN